jgi:crotonobetainyl-CoA:carnitine CoA-transferase CaiB-like acyl-CoA transferase
VSDQALGGIRVVETAGVAAEFAGRLLADFGAEVWKIEPPEGAPTRRVPPFFGEGNARSLFFSFYNAGKRSLVADPSRRTDREAVRGLVGEADVWLDSTPPNEPLPWELDVDAVRAANPPLVIVRITPFGLTGPYAGFRSSDLVAQAAGGMVFTNGFPNETPLQGFGLQAYHAASAYSVIGTLLALLDRGRSGRGQVIDVSLQEAVAGALEETSAAWNAERRIEIRRGPLHWSRVFRTSRCRDGFVMLCLFCDWATLIGWMTERGFGAELGGEEWDDFYHRREHAEKLFAVLDRWAAEQTAEELLAGAQLRRLPFAAVRSPEALLEDPQLADRGFFAPIPGTRLRFPGAAFRMSKTPLVTRSDAPRLGASSWPAPASAPQPGLLAGWRGSITFPRETGAQRIRTSGKDGQGDGQAARRVLDGIRVLDFTHVVAGPIATRILADHGAEVIKIERTTTLDRDGRRGGFFGVLNRGKRSLILNMSDPRGIDLAKRLAATSDVVADNFSARVMDNWGMDYEALRKLRPDIIAIGMSGFGKTGPQKDYVSFGPTLQALCGHTMMMRPVGRDPAGWGFSHADICGGLNGALAVLAALHHRARTGEGQFIDLSQLESVTAYMGPVLLDVVNSGTVPKPMVNRSQEAPGAPHGVYRCSGEDRWVAISILRDEDWRRFANLVGEPWTADPRFTTNAARLEHAALLDDVIERWTRTRSPEEVTALCQRSGVAAFTVANGEDLCARDPHLQWRGYWARLRDPEGRVLQLDGVPPKLSETPGFVASPGPLHGEHTDRVLRDVLGLSAGEVNDLRAENIVA